VTGKVIDLRNAGGDVEVFANSIAAVRENGDIPRISCMDYRLNDLLDSKKEGDGSGSKPESVTHKNCGAMGVVDGALAGKLRISDRIMRTLVDQFRTAPYKTAADLEIINAELQRKRLEERTGTPVTAALVEVDVNMPHAEKTLLISKPSEMKFADLIKEAGKDPKERHVYILQALWIDELLPSIEIAVRNLGIKDVVLVANGNEAYRQINMDLAVLRMQKFIDDEKISPYVVRLSGRARSRT
jgi:carbonic anhydrase